MKLYKEVYTTGEAAKICRVSQQTIIRCFDEGRLKGFKVPGSRFRRIPKKYLIAFMKEYGLGDPNSTSREALIGCQFPSEVTSDGGWKRANCSNGWELGLQICAKEFDLIVIDLQMSGLPTAAANLLKCIRSSNLNSGTLTILLCNGIEGLPGDERLRILPPGTEISEAIALAEKVLFG